jgi:inorganic phosphate transporter, PiT family
MIGVSVDQIVIFLALLLGFYVAWNIGANDVANAMGTSVGSKAMTLRGAVIAAAVFEFSGALLVGGHVTETLEGGIVSPELFAGDPWLLVKGMFAALLASGILIQMASYFGWPISTTHAIVGALVGFGLLAGGVGAIQWGQTGYIALSWVISPLLSGLLGYAMFMVLRQKVLYAYDPVRAARRLIPYFVFLIFAIFTLMVTFGGLHNLKMNLALWQAILISCGVGVLAAIAAALLLRWRLHHPTQQETIPQHAVGLAVSLSKAARHLQKAQFSARGPMHDQLSRMSQDLESMSRSVNLDLEFQETTSSRHKIERIFRYLQIVTGCSMAFAHGANDVANAIGPLAAIVETITSGVASLRANVPIWMLVLGGAGIVVGLATWGWRVIETVGRKITELTPTRGFSAEFGAATTIIIASRMGLPISSTHSLVGAVMGVGLARGMGALNLSTLRDIGLAWLITLPASALLAMALYSGINYFSS